MVAWRIAVGVVSLATAAGLAAGPQVRDNSQLVTGTAKLAGVIVSGDEAAAPIRSATVTLTNVTGSTPSRSTETNERGEFVFADLPAGRYEIGATKPAYLRASYGAVRPLRPGTPVALSAGQELTALMFKMWRGGVITGLLLDEKTRPLPGITVFVRRLQTVNGIRNITAATVGSAITDSRGFYRIFGLAPGDYAVLSTITGPGRPSQPMPARQTTAEDVQRALRNDPRTGRGTPPPSPPSTAPVLGYAPVFYPGTTVAVDAAIVHVAAGEERTNIDFAAGLVPLSEVSGTIAPPADRPLVDLDVTVWLNARSMPSGLVASRSIPVAADGTFRITAVTPGPYTLMARATPRPVGSSDKGLAIAWWAATPVTIDGRHLSGLYLTLEPGVTVTGRVVFDGTPPLSMATIGVSVRLIPAGEGRDPISDGRFTTATPEGTFTFAGVTPGDYLLTATLNPRGATLAGWAFTTASAGTRDITDIPLTIASGKAVSDAVVTFTNRPTEIDGLVQDASGRPSYDHSIAVFPVNRALWSAGARRVQLVRPATDGTYLITGLPPGEYALAPVRDVSPDDLQSRTLLEQLLAASLVQVSLKAGAKVTQNIRVPGAAVRSELSRTVR
jgi:hypothetical protein